MTDEQAESTYFDELTELDYTLKFSYTRIGIICREVFKQVLYVKRIDPATKEPCASLHRWIKLAAPWSYATANAALRDVTELSDIPDQHLAEIPASNIPIVKQLSTAVRAEPAVLEAAKTKPASDFVEAIRESHPDQHLEVRQSMRFSPEESAAAKIEEAITFAYKHGAQSRTEALELICITAIEQWRYEEEIEAASERIEK